MVVSSNATKEVDMAKFKKPQPLEPPLPPYFPGASAKDYEPKERGKRDQKMRGLKPTHAFALTVNNVITHILFVRNVRELSIAAVKAPEDFETKISTTNGVTVWRSVVEMSGLDFAAAFNVPHNAVELSPEKALKWLGDSDFSHAVGPGHADDTDYIVHCSCLLLVPGKAARQLTPGDQLVTTGTLIATQPEGILSSGDVWPELVGTRVRSDAPQLVAALLLESARHGYVSDEFLTLDAAYAADEIIYEIDNEVVLFLGTYLA
jgi:hypothetical protein